MKKKNEELDLSLLCKYCFQVLESALDKKDYKQVPLPEEFKGKSYPLFVTWTLGKEKELRGCIGTFEESKLDTQVGKYALKSAFEDYRFEDPINKNELKSLNCEVSLLINFEKAKDAMDWEVGTHGIDIEFEDSKGTSFTSTFLPEVAQDEGWDKRTTLKYLVQKSGYMGSLDKVIKNIRLTRYQSLKKTISYNQYKKMK